MIGELLIELIMRLKIVLSRRVAVELTSCVCVMWQRKRQKCTNKMLCVWLMLTLDQLEILFFLLFFSFIYDSKTTFNPFFDFDKHLSCVCRLYRWWKEEKCINIYSALLWDGYIYISCASLWGELDLSLMWKEKCVIKQFFSLLFQFFHMSTSWTTKKKKTKKERKTRLSVLCFESNEMLFHVCKCLPGRGSHLTLLLLLNRINNGERWMDRQTAAPRACWLWVGSEFEPSLLCESESWWLCEIFKWCWAALSSMGEGEFESEPR